MRDDEYVVCPHCGYKHNDAWEFRSGEHSCEGCNGVFRVAVETTRTYTTSKAEGESRS